MEVTTDILLRGSAWNKCINELGPIFSTRTNYSIFILCLSIGIMYDKTIDKPEENGEDIKSVPRNVIQNNDNGKLDFFFQAAIMSTSTVDYDENYRLELAFGDYTDFDKIGFLRKFANYGDQKLSTIIGDTTLESMDNIKNFLVSSANGENLDIDEIEINPELLQSD